MQDFSPHKHGQRPARLTAAVAAFVTRPALGGFAAGEPAQRRARMLTALLTTLILLAVIALIVVVIVDPAGSPRRGEYGALITGTLLVLAGAFALNRAGLYKAAAALTVACAVVAPWGAALLDPRVVHGDFVPLTYVVVPVLLSGILLSVGLTAIVSIAQIVALFVFATTAENAAPINWPSLCTMVLFVSALSIVASYLDGRDLDQIVRQNAQLEESHVLLREQSVRDHVSGLFNRRYLEETLERELHRAARNETSLGIVMMDVDRFKPLNDRYGHATGDAVLAEVARRLRTGVREQDTVARLGGDEFVILAAGLVGDTDIGGLCNKMIDALRQPIQVQGNEVFIGGSFGCAEYPNHGDDEVVLLERADAAMYQAKTCGGNTYVIYAGGATSVPALKGDTWTQD